MAKEKNVKNDQKSFMKDFKAELKRVVWPKPKQMVNNVVAVITIVFVTVAIVFVCDGIFETVNAFGINKLKSHIESNIQSETQIVDGSTSNEQTANNNENSDNNTENTNGSVNSDNAQSNEQVNNNNQSEDNNNSAE